MALILKKLGPNKTHSGTLKGPKKHMESPDFEENFSPHKSYSFGSLRVRGAQWC